MRPQAKYRARLVYEIEALRSRRVLEVGCGGGGFLRSVAHLDLELVGIDPDAASVALLRDEGFGVREGRAQQLDFADASFDAVVFCFTAHHVEHWAPALREALRVGGTVLVLDPWYDTRVASQRVAERFDRWCKAIDRAGGMVHHDCLDAERLSAPLAELPSRFDTKIEYLLEPHELGIERLEEIAQEHLNDLTDRAPWIEELDSIRVEARRYGFSDDGAILLSVSATNSG